MFLRQERWLEWGCPSLRVNKVRPRQAPTRRKLSSKHISWRFESVNGFIPSLCMSKKLSEICILISKARYDDRSGESPWRSWRYLICIITRDLCSNNACLFNDKVMAICVSYWRGSEFPNCARLHRGRMTYISDVYMRHDASMSLSTTLQITS